MRGRRAKFRSGSARARFPVKYQIIFVRFFSDLTFLSACLILGRRPARPKKTDLDRAANLRPTPSPSKEQPLEEGLGREGRRRVEGKGRGEARVREAEARGGEGAKGAFP